MVAENSAWRNLISPRFNLITVFFAADQLDSFHCLCTRGWTGDRCQEDVDECLTSINRHRTDLQLTLRQTPSHHDASLSSMEVNMMASRQEMASMEEDYH